MLSALVINYNTTALTRSCVDSLRAQALRRRDGGSEPPHIVVVDNASRTEERQALAGIAARVIYNDDNRGYGAALNQALAETDSEFVLFSNADTWYLPGALQRLIDVFRFLPHCGGVSPKLWWDRERTFLLPPSDPVTFTRRFFEATLGQKTWGRRWLRHSWRKRALHYWRARRPLPQAMLSGACLLTTREVAVACGGFDEQFRLYYEDTDWCRRVRQKGYQLYYVPTADVVHLHNQSARQERERTQQIGNESEARYWQKHYGAWIGAALAKPVVEWRVQEDDRWGSSSSVDIGGECVRDRQDFANKISVDLGPCIEPPVFSLLVSLHGKHLWQLSPFPSCVPAIARFVSTMDDLTLPQQAWSQLDDGDFYARLFSLPDWRPVYYWRWRKVSTPA
jgi:GT2 family glycosyltransferase